MRLVQSKSELHEEPLFCEKAVTIHSVVKNLSFSEFSSLMKVKGTLANEAYDIMQRWSWPHNPETSEAAALAYNGPAFKGLNAKEFSLSDQKTAQAHLRILSGLYGILRPYDYIMQYRLEAQTPLGVGKFSNLYSFWNNIIAKNIEADLKKMNSNLLINLASAEYSKLVLPHLSKKINVVNIFFKEIKSGKPFINVVETKKARGMMSAFIVKNKIMDAESIMAFDLGGYYFDRDLSDGNNFTFLRV